VVVFIGCGRHSDGTRHSTGPIDLNSDTAPGQECPTNYVYNGSVCELKTGLKIVQRGGDLVWSGTGEVLCTLTGGGIASKIVNGIVKNVPKAAKWFAEKGVGQIIEHPCDQAWEELQELSTSQIFEPETVPPVNDDDAPDDPDAPDNTDYTYDGGEYARKMCAEHSVEYFCNLISANEQNGGQ